MDDFKVCGSVGYSPFMVLCSRHLYLVLEHSHHPQRKPCTKALAPHPPLPSLRQPLICSLPLWVSLLWMVQVLRLSSFPQHVVFKVRPQHSMCRNFILHCG